VFLRMVRDRLGSRLTCTETIMNDLSCSRCSQAGGRRRSFALSLTVTSRREGRSTGRAVGSAKRAPDRQRLFQQRSVRAVRSKRLDAKSRLSSGLHQHPRDAVSSHDTQVYLLADFSRAEASASHIRSRRNRLLRTDSGSRTPLNSPQLGLIQCPEYERGRAARSPCRPLVVACSRRG
jgi:hypothetical protein